MDEQEEVQQNNMISNLPLLFANGYPTSLDKITDVQLESFIPFMVQCSLGHINLQTKIDSSEPEWWPEDLPFTIPFSKPKKFTGDWMEKMKEVVIICYQFHKSVFLLRFCNDLASYEHASLRFINNYNSTTSLFDRRSNKLLVTFRNENMSYDQLQRGRKCLLQQKVKNGHQAGQELQQMMVEPAPFDIYLCDNCDAELYSKEAILEHEKTCNVDDDDVILCDTPEPQDVIQQLNPKNNENNELRKVFLQNFNLQCRDDMKKMQKNEASVSSGGLSHAQNEESAFMIIDRNKRMPRRNRAVHSLTRCPTIPLSSPAGQLLLRTTKTMISSEYLSERLDRIERFCHAPLLSKSSCKPKYLDRKFQPSNPHCTFKKPQGYSSHMYVFPRRQFSQRRRTQNILFLNSTLLKRCRPISVRLKKITELDLKCKKTTPNTKLNIKLTRDATRSSTWKISPSSKEVIVDTIDLCSSEDEEECANSKSQSTLLKMSSTVDNHLRKLGRVSAGNKANFSRARLKQISNCLNSSEVSLIPIRKSINNCATKLEKANMRSSLLRVVSSSASELFTDNKNTSSRYDGNILLSSPSAPIASENGIVLPKPLRPYYILSNCTTNPLSAIVTNSNELVSSADSNNLKSQNQENQVNGAGTGSTIASKRATIGSMSISSSSDWFSGSNTFTSNSLNNTNNGNQNLSVERERPTRSLNFAQPFSSPGRVVSIDLTS